MKNKFTLLSIFIVLLASASLRADEGMWIPILLEKYNIRLMQEKGFKLTSEDIYSINKASMKDGIMIFGGGCTGELISPEGLLITNHHCGYGQIQEHSSLEHDYLTNGFWAMSRSEELPNPGLTVTFLKYMEDVTQKVLKGITDGMEPAERDKIINANIAEIRNNATKGPGYSSTVRPFFMSNQYFLFVNQTFRDVRLVGAPPSAIGKFGGETDNWIWPRHTGDFSLFRIYAGKDNKPADFSPDNVPYKPDFHFPVSLKGIKEGDFTMVFGYPGSTNQYVPSYHIDMVKNYLNPKMIAIRTKKIEIMEAAMATDPLIRIQYSAKKSGIANSWKKWIGELQGLEKMKTVENKQEFEKGLAEWIGSDETRNSKYGKILPRYSELYSRLREYSVVNNFTNEVLSGSEVFSLARSIKTLAEMYERNEAEKETERIRTLLLSQAEDFFKDYNMETDMKLFVACMKMYGETLPENWLAPEYKKLKEKLKGDFESFALKAYPKTVFSDKARFTSFVKSFSSKSVQVLKKDPFYLVGNDASEFISDNVRGEVVAITSEIQQLNRLFMAAQLEYGKDKVFYPDANSTLRVSYGEVKGYRSRDAVYFTHQTTLRGIMEKDNPEIYDYDVPDKLKELYRNRDFGRYTQDGEVPVCFIANNHTTGGNSGSPVINAEGHLIGVNFDRAWEGVASDMAFNPEQSRNISLDIRYALFLIDKFAGAGYLLKEMTIIE